MRVTPISPSSCGATTTPTHPSATPITAEIHMGASSQANLKTIAASAPAQTMLRTTQRQAPLRASRPKAV